MKAKLYFIQLLNLSNIWGYLYFTPVLLLLFYTSIADKYCAFISAI